MNDYYVTQLLQNELIGIADSLKFHRSRRDEFDEELALEREKVTQLEEKQFFLLEELKRRTSDLPASSS